RYTSIISVSLIFILLLLVGIRSIQDGDVFTKDKEERSPIKWWPDNAFDVAYSIPFVMGAFLCQFNVLPIFTELADPNSMPTAVNMAMVAVSCLYFFIAVLGYFYALDGTCDTILHNFGKSDPYAQTARSMITIALF